HQVGEGVGQVDDQRSQAHGSDGDRGGKLYDVHGGEEHGTHGEHDGAEAQGAGSTDDPVAGSAQRLVGDHQEQSHGHDADDEAHADVLGAGLVHLVGHEAADGAAHHFQAVLVDDA